MGAIIWDELGNIMLDDINSYPPMLELSFKTQTNEGRLNVDDAQYLADSLLTWAKSQQDQKYRSPTESLRFHLQVAKGLLLLKGYAPELVKEIDSFLSEGE